MTLKLNPRWLAAALVWLMAILVSCLNYGHFQEITTIREKNEGMRQEMIFQHRNAAQNASSNKNRHRSSTQQA